KDKSFFENTRLLEDVDWGELLNESRNQKVFPLVYNYLEQFSPSDWEKEYIIHQEKVDDYLDELASILKLADEMKISLVLQKGLSISMLIYNDPYMRQIGDVDFLIHESDVNRADSMLRSLGYLPACGKSDYWRIVNEDDYRYLPVPLLKD